MAARFANCTRLRKATPSVFLRELGSVIALLGGLLAPLASASAAEPIAFDRPSCERLPLNLDRLIELLRVELSEMGIDISPKASTHLSLESNPCDPGTRTITLHLTGSSSRSRIVDLGDVPLDARPRAVAIAAAELVSAPQQGPSQTAQEQPKLPTVAPTAPSPPPPMPSSPTWYYPTKPTEAPPSTSRFVGGLSLLHRTFPLHTATLTGAELRASIGLTGPWRIRSALLAYYGETTVPLGAVQIGGLSAAAGVSYGVRNHLMGFDVGPRLEVGTAASSSSEAAPANRRDGVSGATVNAGIDVELDLYITRGFATTLGLEAGGSIAGISATSGNQKAAGTTGPFVGLHLGFAVAF